MRVAAAEKFTPRMNSLERRETTTNSRAKDCASTAEAEIIALETVRL
jgi:hypothetical protein